MDPLVERLWAAQNCLRTSTTQDLSESSRTRSTTSAYGGSTVVIGSGRRARWCEGVSSLVRGRLAAVSMGWARPWWSSMARARPKHFSS